MPRVARNETQLFIGHCGASAARISFLRVGTSAENSRENTRASQGHDPIKD